MRLALTTLLVVSISLPMAAQVGGHTAAGFGLRHQPVVTGAPFTATVTSSRVQKLPDGNTIQQSYTGYMARDSHGRIYERQTIPGGRFAPGTTKTIVFITDPVGGWSYVLDESKATATRRPLHSRVSNDRPEQQLRGDENAADLGQDASSGVTANGKSITHTVPAGAIGNSAPIVSTVQQWYSSELQIVVKSVRNDPRFGQSTYALSGIVRTEPDASLFQVPAEYKITDAPGRGLDRATASPRN